MSNIPAILFENYTQCYFIWKFRAYYRLILRLAHTYAVTASKALPATWFHNNFLNTANRQRSVMLKFNTRNKHLICDF